ncbi:hypothetical protein [Streptomyces sp. ODS28]|uniref:hypothetical protein n=1 Tax=Streptomyces sp. ODS28 TaxID=3136688 RepID=UPI0031EBA323
MDPVGYADDEALADHADGEALRSDGNGTHSVRGVDSKTLEFYVDGVINERIPNIEPKYGLRNGREAFWDPAKESVVMVGGDGGSVFTSEEGHSYFEDLE